MSEDEKEIKIEINKIIIQYNDGYDFEISAKKFFEIVEPINKFILTELILNNILKIWEEQ